MSRLTAAQASFIDVEVLGRHADSPELATEVAAIGAARSVGVLLVTNSLATVLLEIINDIDDAIESGESERRGYGNARAARGLHRTGSALLTRAWAAV